MNKIEQSVSITTIRNDITSSGLPFNEQHSNKIFKTNIEPTYLVILFSLIPFPSFDVDKQSRSLLCHSQSGEAHCSYNPPVCNATRVQSIFLILNIKNATNI